MVKAISISAVLLITLAACAGGPDVEKLPVGSEVEVTRQDGGVVRGKLAARDEKTVQVDDGAAMKPVARDQIADVRIVDETKPDEPLPPVAKFREYTVPAGTKLSVRLNTAVASDRSRVEDSVEAALTEAVVIGNATVLPVGSIVRGEVASVQPSGKVKGRASLSLRFRSVAPPSSEEQFALVARYDRRAPATKGEDAAKIGIPAGAGAVIGGIVGGKKGAAIGATVGGGAGTAVVLSTSGEEVELPRGTALTLPVEQAIEVRVPIAPPQPR